MIENPSLSIIVLLSSTLYKSQQALISKTEIEGAAKLEM